MSTVTSSPSASDFIYGPTTSFEASDFAADTEPAPSEYVERMIREFMPESIGDYEQTAVDAGTDQVEAYANDQSNHADERVSQTRAEIQTLSAAEEHQRLLERRARIEFSGSVGRNIQAVRDQLTANRESAAPGLLNFLKPKEVRDAAKVARMSERQLIQAESEVGRTLFGPVSPDARREFFCLDEDTWIWHEEWTADGAHEARTTRYEIRGDDIIKSQDGELRSYINDGELANFVTAERLYYDRVMRTVYRRDPATGRPLIDAGA